MGIFDSIFGGGGGEAASKAADAQVRMAMMAAAVQQAMYSQARADVEPWRTAGGAAVGQQAGLLGLPGYTALDPTSVLKATPGYQWGLGQGLEGLARYGAATGLGQSGAALKGANNWAQNYALQQAWNPYQQNLQNLSGAGLNAGTFTGSAGIKTGQLIGEDYMAAGQAQAQGIMQAYNAQQQQNANLFGGLSTLASIGLAPFTGGASLLGMGASALGGLFGGGGGGGFDVTDPGIFRF